MRDEAVLEVGVDARGRIFVQPAESTFDEIFRTAAGVSWDETTRTLLSSEPREWTLADWFEQILAVVADEYGVGLRLTPSTKWSNISPELQRDVLGFSKSDWVTELLTQRKQNDLRYWQNHELKEALSQADSLWVERQYADYVRVLAPHRYQISAAQRKRLTIAEKRAHD